MMSSHVGRVVEHRAAQAVHHRQIHLLISDHVLQIFLRRKNHGLHLTLLSTTVSEFSVVFIGYVIETFRSVVRILQPFVHRLRYAIDFLAANVA